MFGKDDIEKLRKLNLRIKRKEFGARIKRMGHIDKIEGGVLSAAQKDMQRALRHGRRGLKKFGKSEVKLRNKETEELNNALKNRRKEIKKFRKAEIKESTRVLKDRK